MTPAQLTVFKAAIMADPALIAARAAGHHGVIAAYYNAAGIGFVWRPSINVDELKTAIDWTAYAALSALKQNTYIAMTQGGTIDATSDKVRTGFVAVFGSPSASLTSLTALAQKVPTRFEALFAVANVTTAFGQIVTTQDVVAAMGA